MTNLVHGLASVSPDYDILFCDVWGVIHDGLEVFPRACEALSHWKDRCGPVVLVSNSPRPSADVVVQLDRLGVPRSAWSALVTSGDATRALLAERTPGPAYCIGAEKDAALYVGLNLEFAEADKAKFIICTGLHNDEIEGPEDYRRLFEKIVNYQMEMICANPDIVVQRGGQLVYCAGALAKLYEGLGGVVHMAGKPYGPIYRLAHDVAVKLVGRAIDRRRILAIGDGIRTDIVGANRQELDVMFISSGINASFVGESSGASIILSVEKLLQTECVSANFVMNYLSW